MALTEIQLDRIMDAQEKRLTSRAGLEADLRYHRRQVNSFLLLPRLTPRQREMLQDHRDRVKRCEQKLTAWGFL